MEWIKCSDRLPENDDDVLVYDYHSGIRVAHFNKDHVSSYIQSDGSLFFTDDGWEFCYESSPTHWMILPQPPE